MTEPAKLNLAPIDTKAESSHHGVPFHGATAKALANLMFTASGRDELVGIWTRRGMSGLPPAVKPLRDGATLGLAPCGLDVTGRVPLQWREAGQTLRLNLSAVLPMFQVRIPRGQLMDMSMTVHADETWGEVLTCNLDNPPYRPSQRRDNARKDEPQDSAGPATA